MKKIPLSFRLIAWASLLNLGMSACEHQPFIEPVPPDALILNEREGLSSSVQQFMAYSAQDACAPLMCPFQPVDFLINSYQKQGNIFRFRISFQSRQNPAHTGRGILHMDETVCDSIWDVWPDPFVGWGGSGLVPIEAIDGGKNLGLTEVQTQLGVLRTNGPTGKNRATPFWLELVVKPDC
ncbi:MAG: hypothetical protein AAF694_30630 [Bacteroidota bacterium]